MESVGVICRLVSPEESYWGKPVYQSFEHLPNSEDLHFKDQFRQQLHGVDQHDDSVSGQLHEGDWHALLKSLGETYGTDAQYASDGFYLRNSKDEHTYWLKAELEENVLEGKIVVRVAGPSAEERCGNMVEYVRAFLPNRRGDRTHGQRGAALPAGERPQKIQVFFSYA
ncbi:MAG: hypothetical protein OES79_13075 [Planctomycetota bacterium]|nr:hypothetical protein [Planctomycetota bacterium]